ncbi:WhiB family transcriptional regulator [Gordonia sp. (in: high G+C Gram-positive bacteria)]|uniref:WhiB family transcriptional regulator n=1 Tax=Gordonia sp. (in: high G+C Gram-positive bacteria) TaxID=84139 RepID=UPI00261AB706|nr:WhiB family transcriptional regulator [Gordonia sp. (in: high G+C Gram-positive bacteria)]
MTPRQLAVLLADLPDLSGAACSGRWELFDEAEPGEDLDQVRYRHAEAAQICRACPVLDDCREWSANLPGKHRPPGVLAGVIPRPAKGSK